MTPVIRTLFKLDAMYGHYLEAIDIRSGGSVYIVALDDPTKSEIDISTQIDFYKAFNINDVRKPYLVIFTIDNTTNNSLPKLPYFLLPITGETPEKIYKEIETYVEIAITAVGKTPYNKIEAFKCVCDAFEFDNVSNSNLSPTLFKKTFRKYRGIKDEHLPEYFDVAFSYASEQQDYVQKLAKLLKNKGLSVFFDQFYTTALWGKNLYDQLDEIYRKCAKLSVLFISEEYATKRWSDHERRSAQARAFEKNQDTVVIVRFDDTEIPGVMPTHSCLRTADLSMHELVEIIQEKAKMLA